MFLGIKSPSPNWIGVALVTEVRGLLVALLMTQMESYKADLVLCVYVLSHAPEYRP